ncbi:MAG: hypothetical protein C0417_05075 [Chlorobiaceae bacterium]|nr:hypothetical protein [Chlorobiaceae bacterium]
MKKSLVIASIVLFAISGCVRSLYPLFTEDDIVFNPALIGTWIETNSKNMWTFEKKGESEYTLYHYEAEYDIGGGKKVVGDTASFIAQTGILGQYNFLDIFPGKPETKIKNSFYNFHLFPLHTISKIWLTGDTLRLSMLDNDWLQRMVDNNAFKISHARINDQIVLTASTEELQQFVLKHAENARAFPNPVILHKAK